MERQKKVIDASVVVKIFAKEDNSKKAFEIVESYANEKISIIVPDLIFMEVLNALRYKNIESNRLKKVNTDLWNFQFEIAYLDEFLMRKAVEISVEYGFSIYDSIYAALAQMHGAELITEDSKLLKFPNSISLNDI
ncbi:PIN domain nuclease [Candidatus Pacearchaeota archaeon CG10_big_fil_rev_8_21_14_0_10_34_76]|nr:MAG: PIN domain nuclease [Candidatus Pacearchaeota archaeon CG10_big_fil_rev_8_21_14_0_10_34_76]